MRVHQGDGNIVTFEADIELIKEFVSAVWDLLADSGRSAGRDYARRMPTTAWSRCAGLGCHA